MPSMVSGESFLRGFHPSPLSFRLEASFSICHDGRCLSESEASLVTRGVFVPKGFASFGNTGFDCGECTAEKNFAGVVVWSVYFGLETELFGRPVSEREKMVSVFLVQARQLMVKSMAW